MTDLTGSREFRYLAIGLTVFFVFLYSFNSMSNSPQVGATTCNAAFQKPGIWSTLRRRLGGGPTLTPVALVLMTKDDMDVIHHWLAYHGDAFGFENLFVFDGSTGVQAGYLRTQSKQFGFHLKQSAVSLNEISAELAAWIDDIKGGYEWIVKVDTDEFLTSAEQGSSVTTKNSISPDHLRFRIGYGLEGLRLPPAATATLLVVQWLIKTDPVEHGSLFQQENAVFIPGGNFKQVYSGARYRRKYFNLGSHHFSHKRSSKDTNAAIVHYHARSYEGMVRIATQTCIGHGYIAEGDSKAIMLQKIAELMPPSDRTGCPIDSCHKVWIVYDDLLNRTAERAQYYEKYVLEKEKKNHGKILRGWRSELEKTVAKYPRLAAPNLATGASNSATGRLFSGQKVRTFDPSLLMFDDSGAAPGAPSTSTVFDGGPSCERWCVVTTIFEPSVALTSTAKLPGWCTVIVGDHKTPLNYLARAGLQDMPSVVFLSAERQQREANERDDRVGAFLRVVPFNHFARKNVGYLYAIAHGARYVFDFDDDNELKSAHGGSGARLPPLREGEEVAVDLAVVQVRGRENTFNPYPLLGAEVGGSWPRGLPMDHVMVEGTQGSIHTDGVHSFPTNRIGVLQSLADHDPDIDAVHRLTKRLPFSFRPEAASRALMVPLGVYSPYNAQATVHTADAMWAALLPKTVPGRVSDIWRGYFAERMFARVGLHVVFTPPRVTQNRNAHSYLADMDAESDLYFKAGKLVEFLSLWGDDSDTVQCSMERLWAALYERTYIELDDVLMAQRWLGALEAVGYIFPPISRLHTNSTAPHHHPNT